MNRARWVHIGYRRGKMLLRWQDYPRHGISWRA